MVKKTASLISLPLFRLGPTTSTAAASTATSSHSKVREPTTVNNYHDDHHETRTSPNHESHDQQVK